MSNHKANHKHLTLSQRIEIEKGLLAGNSFATIAKMTRKDPSTYQRKYVNIQKSQSARIWILHLFHVLREKNAC